jgi:hypothetical protein
LQPVSSQERGSELDIRKRRGFGAEYLVTFRRCFDTIPSESTSSTINSAQRSDPEVVMKRILPALLFVSILSWGQSNSATVYLDPNSPFSPDFSAALQKKNVPVTVTTDPAQAQYLANITLANNNGSVFQGITSVLTTGTYNNGAWDRATVQIVNPQTKAVVFSYTCKKYSQNSSDPSKSVAECLAKHWKNKLEGK